MCVCVCVCESSGLVWRRKKRSMSGKHLGIVKQKSCMNFGSVHVMGTTVLCNNSQKIAMGLPAHLLIILWATGHQQSDQSVPAVASHDVHGKVFPCLPERHHILLEFSLFRHAQKRVQVLENVWFWLAWPVRETTLRKGAKFEKTYDSGWPNPSAKPC